MAEHVAQPFLDVGADGGLLARGVGVEALADRRQRERRHDERPHVDPEHVVDRHLQAEERPADQWPENRGGREAGLDLPVRSDQVVGVDQTRDRRELARLEEDRQRGADEAGAVDPPDVQVMHDRQDGDRRDHGSTQEVDRDHHPLAVQAVGERADHQAEEQVRDHLGCGRDREVDRRAGQLEHEQRQREKRE